MIGTLDLADELALLRLTGPEPCLPIPPDCAALWQRGQAGGAHLRTLYLLRLPLSAGQGGGWNPSGDVWVWDVPGTPERTRLHLLHEIAHGVRNQPPAATIDAHWDEEVATWHQARALATAWGLDHLLSAAELAARLEDCERFRDRYHAAAELAGTTDLPTVRGAFAALLGLRAAAGWDEATFEAALWGYVDADPADPAYAAGQQAVAAAMTFDRGQLRSGWRLGLAPGVAFAALARPQTERSAGWLRAALKRAAQRRAGGPSDPRQADSDAPIYWLTLTGEQDLGDVIACANTLLLDHPTLYAGAGWWCYADPAAAVRLYRLDVAYYTAAGGAAVQTAALWILVAAQDAPTQIAEAALQGYIQSWQRVQRLICESLADGLRLLWVQRAVGVI